jgi:hypothetical protein
MTNLAMPMVGIIYYIYLCLLPPVFCLLNPIANVDTKFPWFFLLMLTTIGPCVFNWMSHFIFQSLHFFTQVATQNLVLRMLVFFFFLSKINSKVYQERNMSFNRLKVNCLQSENSEGKRRERYFLFPTQEIRAKTTRMLFLCQCCFSVNFPGSFVMP